MTLEGAVETKEFGHEIVELLQHVQGVVAVRDRLSYPPPPEPPEPSFDVIARFPVD